MKDGEISRRAYQKRSRSQDQLKLKVTRKVENHGRHAILAEEVVPRIFLPMAMVPIICII